MSDFGFLLDRAAGGRSLWAMRTGKQGPATICVRPGPALREDVPAYRGFRLGSGRRRRLEIPTGMVTVVFGFGGHLRLSDAVGEQRIGTYTSLFSGMRTSATLGEHDGRMSGIEVSLTPSAAFRIFRIPMSEVSGQILDVADLPTGRALEDLTARLTEQASWRARFALLDRALTERWRTGPEWRPQVTWAWREVLGTAGRVTVERLAGELGWSRRHLERCFREQVGLSPRSTGQIVRLQTALRMQEAGVPLSRVAVDAGFYDQAHLHRAWRTMVGCTPGRFGAVRSATPSSSLDRIPGQVTSALLTD